MKALPLLYPNGIEISAGDRVRFHGDDGFVEFTAERGDAETSWYIEQFGPGCMIVTESIGHVFLSDPEQEEDLEFVHRNRAT